MIFVLPDLPTLLPYWDKEIEVNIGLWQPYKIDYEPVSSNFIFGERFASIAELAFELESELLLLRSHDSGYCGALARGTLGRPRIQGEDQEGFCVVFSYSSQMENAIGRLIENESQLLAGISLCSVNDERSLIDEFKVILLASILPLDDEDAFLTRLESALRESLSSGGHGLSFFAEKFGYRRFSIPYETENLTQVKISAMLFEFEMEETLEVLGPIPEVTLQENDDEDNSEFKVSF